jgi:protocatechuate 3,4-dioxygenase beta subunit
MAEARDHRLTRRDSLRIVGGTAALLVTGGLARIGAAAPQASDCVVRPEQTEGPYFVDEKLLRSDIRSDPSDGSLRPGTPLELAFVVSRTDGASCAPLPEARVDVWHCDAGGVYSDVRDPGFETVGKKFLRGQQIADEQGRVRFMTIYPGWYRGRAVHIHFKIRSGREEFTSQLYFDEALSDRVFARAPYSGSGKGRLRNEDDGIFAGEGEQLQVPVKEQGEGLAGLFRIALKIG